VNDNIISCSNVTKHFNSGSKRTDVLNDVAFSSQAGEIVLIQGRSGTGKSTLLRILAGLERPSSGRVEIAGESIEKLSSAKLARLRSRTIGYIFQNFNLIPSWTALENVEAALISTNLSRNERRQKAGEWLAELGLADRTDHLPSELSIGQQQRVAIARALINTPKIVFADEPSGDVDSETANSIIDCLVNLVRQRRTTLIVCTHGIFPQEIADRLYILKQGKITEQNLGIKKSKARA
jgi:putative ABC transport system ATP-binding protein